MSKYTNTGIPNIHTLHVHVHVHVLILKLIFTKKSIFASISAQQVKKKYIFFYIRTNTKRNRHQTDKSKN